MTVAEHNVRLPLDRFVGRAALLAALPDTLARARLVSLVGGPGIGKTRLAAELARVAIAGAPPLAVAAVWWVDLHEARDDAALLAELAQTLGVSLPPDGDAAAGAIQRSLVLRPPTLLVLDNLEQVPSEALQPIAFLLERTPHLFVLATSQRRLGLRGERVVELGGLAADGARAEAVALLASRIEDASGRAPALDDLVPLAEALGGVPLALELAAARASLLDPKHLLERLGSLLDGLRGHGRSDRHATLRAALRWSWDLLEPAQQHVLAKLSAFRGSVAVDDALAVVADDPGDALDALQHLRDRSLLQRDPDGRLRLYPAVDELAAEELDALGLALETHARHARWAARFAAEALAGLDTHRRPEVVARLIPNRANFAAAIARGLAMRDRITAEELVTIAEAAVRLDLVSATTHEATRALAEVLEATADAPLPDAAAVDRRARAYAMLARAHSIAGNRASVIAAIEAGETLGEGRSAETMATYRLRRAQLDLVQREMEPCVAACAEILRTEASGRGWAALRARAAGIWSRAEMLRGRHDVAVTLAVEGLGLARQAGDPLEELSLLIDLSRVALYQARLDDTIRWGREALDGAHALEVRHAAAYAENLIAFAAYEAGNVAAAVPHQQTAAAIFTRLGHRHAPPMRAMLAQMLCGAGRFDEARTELAEANRASVEIQADDPTWAEFRSAVELQLAWQRGDLPALRQVLGERIALAETAGDAVWARAAAAQLAAAIARYGSDAPAPATLLRSPNPDQHWTVDDALVAEAGNPREQPRSVAAAVDIAAASVRTVEPALLAGLLAAVTTPPEAEPERGPWVARSASVRVAHKRLVEALERAGVRLSSVAPAAAQTLEVTADGKRFRPPGGPWVDLGRKHKLRALLRCVVEQRLAHGDAPLDLYGLVDRVWPGEKILPEAAANRTYYSISSLRKAGLGDLLETTPDGYRIMPGVEVREVAR